MQTEPDRLTGSHWIAECRVLGIDGPGEAKLTLMVRDAAGRWRRLRVFRAPFDELVEAGVLIEQ